MPALNFKSCWAAAVEAGLKRQTIRPQRKAPIKPGDRLYLYTGLRTRMCHCLSDAACCRSVEPIAISDESVTVAGRKLAAKELVALAHRDGFATPVEMLDFFRAQYGLPFSGMLIKW